MPLAVEFHPEARTDFYEAIDWYEHERAGLGASFSVAVQEAVRHAADFPLAGAGAGPDLRRVFVRRFPYSILYASEPTRLWVLAVAHFRRRPGYWHQRR